MQSLTFSIPTLQQIATSYSQELSALLNHQPSSLSCLPHQIFDNPVPAPEVQVFSIGGSNIYSAVAQYHQTRIHLKNISSQPFSRIANKSQLFQKIADLVNPQLPHIGINFAFPLRPVVNQSRPDGVFEPFGSTKEKELTDLVGCQVGLELEQVLTQKFNREFQIYLANDTVCLALAGLNLSTPEKILGLIVGTGTNSSVFQNNQILNLESAGFDKFDPTQTGQIVDQNSHNPGQHPFEKEISGAYLYQHFNLLSKKKKLQSTKELDLITKTDQSQLGHLANQLFMRSASLIAAQITGTIKSLNTPKLDIIGEGSILWDAHNYLDHLKKTLTDLGVKPEQYHFHRLEHSYLYGAARLVCSQTPKNSS